MLNNSVSLQWRLASTILIGVVALALPARASAQSGQDLDLIWQHRDLVPDAHTSGQLAIWRMTGTSLGESEILVPDSVADMAWHIVDGSADFDGDGEPDLLWRNDVTGQDCVWYMHGAVRNDFAFIEPAIDPIGWRIAGTADFNGDGHPDIIWQNAGDGTVVIWEMNGIVKIGDAHYPYNQIIPQGDQWRVVGAADLSTPLDGVPDLVFQKNSGEIAAWFMNGFIRASGVAMTPASVSDPLWKIVGVGDVDNDGRADLIWQYQTGSTCIGVWYMNGVEQRSGDCFAQPAPVDVNWRIVGIRRRPRAAGVVFTPAPGTYTQNQTITLSTSTAGAAIYFTTDASEPSTSSTLYSSPVPLTTSATIRARAFRNGWDASASSAPAVYTLTPVTPTFSPAQGTFTAPQNVTISTATAQAEIRYTIDGTTPTLSSALYGSPVPIATGTTLQAVAFRTGWTPSGTATGTYTMNFGPLPTPTISPAAGTYTGSANVTLSSIAGAIIRYTLNGTDPTPTATLYGGPFSVSTTSTLNVRAWHPDYAASPVASAAYTILVAAPTLLPASGSYPAGQAITVATTTPAATITYTLNGADPVQSDPSIVSGGTLTAGNYTLKAKAWKSGATPSGVTTATYVVNGQFVMPVVKSGYTHTLALRSDGTIWGWGDNYGGQVGDGTVVGRLNPVPIPGLTGVRSVSTGGAFTIARLSDGTLRLWGMNNNGQLGDGTGTNRPLPTPIALSGVTSVVGGSEHTVAALQDGTVRTWGYNAREQVGDNSTTTRYAPVTVGGLTAVTAVAAGDDHSLALKSDGTVWAWGGNQRGQIGDGTLVNRWTPVQVNGLTNVVAVGAGSLFSVALKGDGTVWTFGVNTSGELGDGTQTDRWTPVPMSAVTNVTAIAAGWDFVLLLKSDGTVWAVGDNNEGQLGFGGSFRNLATQIPSLSNIVSIGAGSARNGFAVSADGSAWGWARNDQGAIGDGTTIRRYLPVPIAGPGMNWRPWIPAIGLSSGQYLTEQNPLINNGDPSAVMHYTIAGADPTDIDPVVAAGAAVSVAQSLTLKVRSFKTGAPPSEIAAATYTLKAVAPALSPGGGTYSSPQTVALSTTTGSSAIHYTTDGRPPTGYSTLYAGPLSIATPTTVKALATRSGWTPSDVASAAYWVAPPDTLLAPAISPAGGTYATERVVTLTPVETNASVRYTVDGTDPTAGSPLYVRGFVVAQTLTIKARTYKAGYTPGPVASSTFTIAPADLSGASSVSPAGGRFTTERVVTVTGPAGATLRYTTTGVDPTATDTVVATGGTVTVDRSMVLKVRAWQTGLAPGLVRREDYVITGAVAAGETFSMALKADGTVWTWGDNYWAELGDGASANRTAPVQVLSGGVAIAAGFHHALVVKADGTVWAWGHNAGGEVGDGTTAMRRSPVPVVGLTNVVAVAASFYNSYALKADGTVWAWGGNAWGQIGDGTTASRLTPVQVPGVSGVRAIAAGESFALAVVSHGAPAGTVWAWGHNNVGQLGSGTTTDSLTPQAVAGAASVQRVLAGRAWAMARTADDELLLWGLNDSGQMGNGGRNSGNTLLPVRTGPWMGPLAEIGAGYVHALALGRDARLWGWGSNCEYELAYVASCDYRLTVEPIPAATSLAFVAGGGNHTIAIAQDGQVWTWGYNAQGQIGDSTLTSRSTPTAVPGFQVANNAFLSGDQDSDGLSTWREYQLGTDPLSADTDGDGIPDGIDTASGDAATNLDPDGDGLSNARETALGTDLYNGDTDGDGVTDGLDAYPRDPTRWQVPGPDPNDHTPPVITLIYPTNARPVGGGI